MEPSPCSPRKAYAQDAGMSPRRGPPRSSCWTLAFSTHPDPAARWKDLSVSQAAPHRTGWRAAETRPHPRAGHRPRALRFKGRTFVNSDGKRNFPSGEFFTGPVEDLANGHIRYTFPAIFGGREVEDVRLRFEGGKAVRGDRRPSNGAFLNEMLDTGRRRAAAGRVRVREQLRNFSGSTRNILFDEKIGGTVHLALGASYPETGGVNEKARCTGT